MMIRVASLLLAALTIGCSTPGLDTVGDAGGAPACGNGSVGGSCFAPQDAISTALSSQGAIWIGTTGGLCDVASNNQWPPNSQDLFISVFDVDANGNGSAPSGPGTYVVDQHPGLSPGPHHLVLATAVALDGNCSVGTRHEVAAYGTVTLTRVDGGSYAGSFDLLLNDRVTGTFDAAACAGLAAWEQGRPSGCSQ
jgi:hypothetical protein